MNAPISKSILIMAGGTGGHIMPGLAIARAMRERGWTVHWLGTTHGMENTLVPQAGFKLDTLEFAGLRGKGAQHAWRNVALLWSAIASARRLIKGHQPNVVLGMGGYITVPGGIAAFLGFKPLALMNSDAGWLLSNRLLAPLARRVLFGFPAGGSKKVVWTGCPIRPEIAALPPPAQRLAGRTGPLRLLVVGGSLGAAVLNRTIPAALAMMYPKERPVVTHQSGAQHLDSLKEAYAKAGVEADIRPFIDDMAACYAEADVVICRAGAITVSELAAAGVASILVPFMVSTTSHQRENAHYMADAGAAFHLPQDQLTPQKLTELLRALDRERLIAMGEAARRAGKADALERVVQVLESIAR